MTNCYKSNHTENAVKIFFIQKKVEEPDYSMLNAQKEQNIVFLLSRMYLHEINIK